MPISRVFSQQAKKEWRALCFWLGITILVLSMLTLFVVLDALFKESATEQALWVLALSLLGLIVGNVLWMLAGQCSIFNPDEEVVRKG